MHILLTDILICPVCGPQYGLIARTDRMRDRSIEEGALGCPHCRRTFPIESGIADLRTETERVETSEPETHSDRPDDAGAMRVAALLGLDRGNGFVLLLGPIATQAAGVAKHASDHPIVADAAYADESPGVSRIRIGSTIPMTDGRLQGLWLSGAHASSNVVDAARVLHPLGRLVLEPAPPHASDAIAAAGMRIVAQQDGTLLAARH